MNGFDPHCLFGFGADGARAQALNAEVNRRLVDSLRYVCGAAGPEFTCTADRLDAWLASLGPLDRLDPRVHVLFHSIVERIEAGDASASRGLTQRLLKVPSAAPGIGIRAASPDPDGDRPLALYAPLADVEAENALDLAAPAAGEADAARALIAEALERIRRNDPGLDSEVNALLGEILLVTQGPAHRFKAPAISCFETWGSLLMGVDVPGGALGAVEMLAHEATHLLLFALAMDEPLLANPPDELHYSPVRGTERTMDGIFHAAIVSARIVRALLRQAHEPDGDIALAGAARAIANFDACAAIVESAGKPTPLGRSILDQTRAGLEELRDKVPALEMA